MKDGVRCAFLDRAPGEERAVITLDGAPERLLVVREDDETPRVGARYAARVEAVSLRMGLARLDMGGTAGTLRLRGPAPLPVGERLAVEVVAEPVRGKPPAVRRLEGVAAGVRPGLLSAAPDLREQLAALGLSEPWTGDDARDAADDAQAAALAIVHDLGDGLDIAIQPTRALTAVDLDLAEDGAAPARANLRAVAHAARLLRLKSIGGLIMLDLVGFPKDALPLLQAAERAFAPDGPGVAVAGPGRFGVLQVAKPLARQPLHERLLDADGRPSARTLAQDTVRALERQARFAPGALLAAPRVPEVAALAAPWVQRLGPRFAVTADPGVARGSADIIAR